MTRGYVSNEVLIMLGDPFSKDGGSHYDTMSLVVSNPRKNSSERAENGKVMILTL